MTKVTWWIDSVPSRWLHLMSDDELLKMIALTKAVTRVIRRGADLPAVGRMWEKNLLGLYAYGCTLAIEANHARGLDDDSFSEFGTPGRAMAESGVKFELPAWHQDEDVQISHIAAFNRESLWRSPGVAIELDEEEEFWPVLWPVATASGYELMISKRDKESMAVDDLYLPDDVRRRVVNL